ncbi:hypothetical protein N656DRAFT_777629 [Canariomyces notabilis]|uniref:Uncharacterized protein n=1 Tax=Canariomyces notabilis TaxID=2074819 RepID=A0AAN6YVE4_9PEZI|nr:hypothetical protein N656DRAFT_777629 [Canariomyces arenarius]
MAVHFWRQDPVPGSETRTNCARPSSLGAGLAGLAGLGSLMLSWPPSSPSKPLNSLPPHLLIVLPTPNAILNSP